MHLFFLDLISKINILRVLSKTENLTKNQHSCDLRFEEMLKSSDLEKLLIFVRKSTRHDDHSCQISSNIMILILKTHNFLFRLS